MIKLIASDLDGTLLPEGTADIDPRIYEVVRRLQEAGITFVAASGRNYESVMSIYGCMEQDLIVISDNGGYCAKNGVGEECHAFSRELLREIMEQVRKVPDVWLVASAARGGYTDMNDPKSIEWIRTGYKMSVQLVDDLLEVEEPLIKLAIYSYEKDAAEVAVPLVETLGDRVSIAVSGERWVDIMMPDISKGRALAHIQKTLGITREETAAFGDNGNDITMLQQAEESFAVANAREEVKEVAKHVIGDVSEGAVISALEQILAEVSGANQNK